MKAIDTNVLIRYLMQDDPIQSPAASKYIKNAGERIVINSIVLCELVWVLKAAYRQPKEVITEVLEKILFTEQFELEDRDSTWRALTDFKQKRGTDFSDCLIGQKNRSLDCEETVTFDRGLKELETFKVL